MMAQFVAFIKGPMVWIAFGVFFGGLVIQAWRFLLVTRKKAPDYLPGAPKKKKKKKKKPKKALGKAAAKPKRKGFMERLQPLIKFADKRYDNLENSMFFTHPVVTVVTVLFHVFLFVTPIFLLAHNELFRKAFGFSLPSLPDYATDTMTIIFLMCGGFFLYRRIFVKRVRAITTPWDFFVLFVTLTPFITGFLAFRQWFDYPTIMIIHIVSGELMLMLIPFTKLGHMIYFFLYRLLIGSEYSFGQGKRAW
jgi:nitrate reductase gamma subunit